MDNSTLSTNSCITFSLGQDCYNDNKVFDVQLQQGSGDCQDATTSMNQLTSMPICVHINTPSNLCYRANLLYNGVIIDTQTNFNFLDCSVNDIMPFISDDVIYELDGEVTNGQVFHLTRAALNCSGNLVLTGTPQLTCFNGNWEEAEVERRMCMPQRML